MRRAQQIRQWFAPRSLWEESILRACEVHAVRPLRVLGVGGFARVLEVAREDDSRWALKVRVLKTPDDIRFRGEWAFLNAHKSSGLPLPHAVSELKEAQLGEEATVASFLMQPVGQPVATEAHAPVRAAYAALRQLHSAGIFHGDPRPENFLQADGKVRRSPLRCVCVDQCSQFLWIDVLEAHEGAAALALRRDMSLFVRTFLRVSPEKAERTAAAYDPQAPWSFEDVLRHCA
jgi:hypothetical protein